MFKYFILFQEITQQTPVVATPPIEPQKSPTPPPPAAIPKPTEVPKDIPKDPVESLPQIELKLPKRPVRERLGARDEPKTIPEAKEKERTESPERLLINCQFEVVRINIISTDFFLSKFICVGHRIAVYAFL